METASLYLSPRTLKRKWSKDNYTPGDGITVIVRNNDVNAALRKFKKKVQDA